MNVAAKSEGEAFLKGVSFGFLAKNGYYSSPAGLSDVEEICRLGVKWVALMATVMQDSYSSVKMYSDYRYTPSDCELAAVIDRLHESGVKVMLKPIIECHDSVWRGMINFPEGHQQIQGIVTDYWGQWFANYTSCVRHYGRFAEAHGVEMLCLGCEMLGAEPQEARWSALIDSAREVYGGLLSYNTDQFQPPRPFIRQWYSKLDLLGISFYTGTKRPDPDAAGIAADLKETAVKIDGLAKEIKIPLFFAECGARSVKGGALMPWDYKLEAPYDGEVQASYMRAVIDVFSPFPWWRGLLWWKWDEQQARPQYRQSGGDAGFTIRGKPAADVLSKWCEG